MTTTISNAVDSFESVLKDVRKYGEQGGAGENARANVFVRLVRGAANGAIDTVKRDKDGNESKDKTARDHAEIAYDAYVNAFGKTNGHSADTVTAKVSTMRAGIRLGQKYGENGVALMDRVHAMYPVLKKAGEKLWQPLDCYYRVALAQLKATHRLSDDEIRAIITRESKERDAAAFLRTAERALERACELDDNDNTRNALEATKTALAAYLAAEQRAADMAALAVLQARLGKAA